MVPVKLQIDVLIINKEHSDCRINLQLYSVYSLGKVRAEGFHSLPPLFRELSKKISKIARIPTALSKAALHLVSKMKLRDPIKGDLISDFGERA